MEKKDNTNSDEKSQLRKQVLQKRAELSEAEKAKASLLLTDRVIGHQWYYRSDIILGFASNGSEINTGEILRDALNKGKKVYLPKVSGETMEFFRIDTLEELIEGYKGIMEPNGKSEQFDYQDSFAERTLVLMPGVAFDLQRNRLGYGKGYYDRYLQDKKELQLRTLGVGFRCQMVEAVPTDEFDIKPYQIICM